MTKNFSLFLALRYLKPKRTFVSIITLISVLGVALGVGVLIVVISVMSGFEVKIKEVVLGFEPHIVVEKMESYSFPELEPPEWPEMVDDAEGNLVPEYTPTQEQIEAREEWEAQMRQREEDEWQRSWQYLRERLEGQESIDGATPFIEGRVLMESNTALGRRRIFPMMRALEPGEGPEMRKIREMMGTGAEDGELDLEGPNLIMSRSKARALGLQIGDTVDVDSKQQIEYLFDRFEDILGDDSLTQEQKQEELDKIDRFQGDMILTLKGVFDSLRYEEFVIIPMTEGRILYEFDTTGDIHGIALHIEDAYKAAEVEKQLHDAGLIPSNWKTETWMEKHQLLFDQIRNERGMMYFVLFFIVIVAAFSIMNTMITVTVQKRKEIGVMKALGAREGQIVWVFLAQGFVVGIFGTLAGGILGYNALFFREPLRAWLGGNFGLEIFPEGLYGVSTIPVAYKMVDTCIIAVGAIVLCTLAALVPAWFAARLDPARALRE